MGEGGSSRFSSYSSVHNNFCCVCFGSKLIFKMLVIFILFIYLFIFWGGPHEPIFWHESSIWVQIRLRAENKLPRWSGSGLKVFGGGWVGFGW